MEQLSVNKCSLVGYSMGGRLALYMAINYPEMFNCAVLESASPGLADAAERERRIKLDETRASRIKNIGISEFLREWYRMPLFAETLTEKQITILRLKRQDNNPAALARSLREMGIGRQPSLWQQLSDIKIPLFLFVGEKDGKFRKIAERMQQNAKLDVITLKGCGHNCHFEKPSLYSKHLAKILKTIV
ncbi:MAG: 2-succinyl-6-hydroxy-2,4-cyclohexadiene-1-carboxylate synthase, partial [Calditrichota bacterium]